MILVSACLLGRPCRYDGRRAFQREFIFFLKNQAYLGICPEQLGGLPTPRPAARLVGGDGDDVLDGRAKVVSAHNEEVTAAFINGAKVVLDLAIRLKADRVYLKDRSPSCGLVYSSNREGRNSGRGVCAALLIRSGFEVVEVKA